jgi:DnaJ family protein C protein 25
MCIALYSSLWFILTLSTCYVQKIARAYEVLTDEETRKEYDFMRYNQEAYMRKYGSDVMWAYAPKTDTLMVIILLLATGSVISWFVQKSHWQKVADKLIKAAAEDWGSNQGGTPESKALRERALKILTDKELEEASANGEVAATDGKKKKKIKLTGTEKRKGQEDSLRPIITELVEEMEDFGAGYHKPTWRDLLVVKAAFFPMSFTMGIIWNAKYMVRRLQKLKLSEDEREVLTRRAVGEVNWASCGEEEQKDMITRDLWVSENMIAWEEGQEVKQWNSVDRKRYLRMKKKETKKGGKEE